MAIAVRGLAEARAVLGRLRLATLVPTITIDLPEKEERKLLSLVHGRPGIQPARDILQLTPKLAGAMGVALGKGLVRAALGRGTAKEAWAAVGRIYLEYLQNRIGFSGGDVASRMAPLAASTIRRKGGNTRMFFHTGALYRAIKRATIRVE